ncbi:DNA-binding death effector domain-containing protein 2-like isoform X1 [Carcharodon carcharias]|uniref:DNA-binding death effector domain-containing protein 2-like isoform X1 n=1 Tax=Carcharodon carcharias TaxID=13397 RepID=UPI001B7EDD6B|nr:DNA-binding death effector domain-containing protein 2-like isoform X1 [Carcharodon carcharias]
MAAVKRARWDEEEVLAYYRMLSLHQMFELVGSQLSQADVEALAFLLDEAYPLERALRAAQAGEGEGEEEEGEGMEEEEGGEAEVPGPASPRHQPPARGPRPHPLPAASFSLHRPKSGVRLLFELERRGLCDETNFRELLQLLRVISRHDLLPYVGQKRGRAVSPERCNSGGPMSGVGEQVERCLNSERADSTQSEWESGASLSKRQGTNRRRGRGSGKRRRRKGHVLRNHEEREHQSPHQQRATCGWLSCTTTSFMMWQQKFLVYHSKVGDKRVCVSDKDSTLTKCSDTRIEKDIRLRVRAVYSDQNTVLRGNVVSVKQDPLDRCFDLFGQANTILKSRDLGSIICDIKFSELSYLDAFWNDYINGSLLEALKGVFITDSLKQAVGQEAIQLLVNVDEDDYEKGRRVLLQNISP